jgi:hypothetical protein
MASICAPLSPMAAAACSAVSKSGRRVRESGQHQVKLPQLQGRCQDARVARHALQFVRIDDGSARQVDRFFVRKKAGRISGGPHKKIRRALEVPACLEQQSQLGRHRLQGGVGLKPLVYGCVRKWV